MTNPNQLEQMMDMIDEQIALNIGTTHTAADEGFAAAKLHAANSADACCLR